MFFAVNAMELIGLVSSVLSIGQFILGIGRRFFKKNFFDTITCIVSNAASLFLLFLAIARLCWPFFELFRGTHR